MQLDGAAAADPWDKLRRIAKYQRWVLVSLLISILSLLLLLLTGAQLSTLQILILRFMQLGAQLFCLVSVFLLAKQFMHIAVAVIVAILQFIPLISLVVLLVVNQQATSYLQSRGVKVGLLGAKADSLH